MMQFEWDDWKAAANLKKHGVSFHEAGTIFGDSMAITFHDPDHSGTEQRFLTMSQGKRSAGEEPAIAGVGAPALSHCGVSPPQDGRGKKYVASPKALGTRDVPSVY